MKWTTQETFPPKYLHFDPETSHQLMCDKCPPGTYLKQHCTARRKTACAPCPDSYYTDAWHTSDECLYCNAACKELQYVKQECNRTHNRVCECEDGRYLEVEFCSKHRSCPPGFGVLKADVTLCEEAFFRFAVPTKVTPNWLSVLVDNLPGTRVNAESVERIERRHSSQEQAFQLLKLWKHQNKGQDTVKKIIQDIELCERSVRRHLGRANLTSQQLRSLMESLPGKKVAPEDIERTAKACASGEQVPKLLSLWRVQNGDQDTLQGLVHALKRLKAPRFPQAAAQRLRKAVRFLHGFAMYRLYQKLFVEMLGNHVQSAKISCL
ncbi:PREDICTED: tumor necrosis factor receptor superfamily member 11B isoform X2 [Miniopterus natalensis]|uniref:tumor necrosis factor receptor superfamily member 11B isoform X2 n=1 Tax=Miniopterus natalensis TaxID=291302 RepID=UPI0007A6F586|nr:PREDICTED: tumor necrosis factor receptor superfamily member 11B isoform X2 [Miniopterus natalensis]